MTMFSQIDIFIRSKQDTFTSHTYNTEKNSIFIKDIYLLSTWNMVQTARNNKTGEIAN